MYPDISQKLSFVEDNTEILLSNTGYFFGCEDNSKRKYLLNLMNSKLIDWYYRSLSMQLGEKAVRMFSIYVLKLPVPAYKETNLQTEIKNASPTKYIDRKVYELYGLSKDEIDYIESV